MAKDLILDVVARKNSRDLSTLADEFDRLSRRVDDSGKSLSRTTSFSRLLDEQIAKTKVQIRDLGVEFDKTGNKDVFAKLRGTQSNLKSLERIKKDLSSAFDDAGQQGGKSFMEGLSSTLRTPTIAAGVTVAAVATGEALGGALLTGIGLAGVGVGIAGVLHDPAVVAAGSTLGKDVSAGFKEATASFQEPLVKGLYVVDTEWKKLQPSLKGVFAELAPLTTDLAKGAAGFIDELVPGLERAALAAKPLVKDFAEWLPSFGNRLGSFFDTLAAHGDDLKKGLHEVETVMNGIVIVGRDLIPVVTTLGNVIDFAKDKVGPQAALFFLHREWEDLNGTAHVLVKSMKDTSGASDELAGAFGSQSQQSQQAAAAAKKLSDEMNALEQKTRNEFSALLDLSSATGNWTHDLANLKGQLDLHDRTLNETTDAGHKNADALRQMAQEAERVREAMIAQAGGENASAAAVDQANTKFRDQIATLEKNAIKAGLSKDAVHTLLDMYLALAKAPDIVKDIKIQQHFITTGNPSTFFHGLARGGLRTDAGIRHAAVGMVIPPSSPGTVLAGEPQTGGEVLAPLRGISRGRAMQLAGLIGNAYGFRVGGVDVPASVSYGVAGRAGDAMRVGGGLELRVTGNPDSYLLTAFLNAYRAGTFGFYDSAGQRVTVR